MVSVSASVTPTVRTSTRRALWTHLGVLGGFFVLALLLWWPLPMRLTTHVPGTPQWAYDEATFVWNIWYFKYALLEHLRSPLTTDLVYYPLGVDLILYTYNFYHVLAAMPLALAFGLPLASNLTLLMSTALSGYGAWLLLRRLLALEGVDRQIAHWAALVGGALFAFASNRSIYAALGHYDMVTTQWIPFYALALLQSLETGRSPAARRRAALLAGVFFAFAGLAEMITALFLAIFTLIVLLAHPGARSMDGSGGGRERPLLLRWRTWLPSLAITGGVAFLLWSPALVPILRQFLTNDYSLKGWGEAIPLSTDLVGWFTPTVLHPWFGSDLVAELRRVQLRALEAGATGFRDLNTVFLGWVSAALALTGVLAWRRRVRIWTWTAVIFGLFTLGPFLQINGEYRFDLDGVDATFPMPYTLLHYIPIIKANRAPNRNSVVLMLALAVLVGFAVAWLLAWWQARRARRTPAARTLPRWAVALPLVAGLLVVGEHLALPLPLTDLRPPAVYAQIAADPRPVSVLQLPLGWRNSFGVFGPEATILQYYQSAHGKPMLGGNTSRAPDFKMGYFQRLPYFQALADIQFGREVAPETLAAAKAQATDLMALYNVGYVLLYPPVEGRPPYSDTWQAAWDFAKATLPLEVAPFWSGDGIEAYRTVLPEPAATARIALDDAAALPNLGEGWDAAATPLPEGGAGFWALTDRSDLYLPPLAPTTDATLRLRVQPYTWPGGPAQSVALEVNGQRVGAPQPLAEGMQEIAFDLPAGALTDGINRLALLWDQAAAPRSVTPGTRAIGTTGITLPVDVDLKAFADGGFMALFDEAGAQSDGSAGRKGVNITVLDGDTGAVLDKRGFDTTANAYESAALAQFLRRVAPGQIALVATNGDAGAFLTPEAVDALRGLGLDVTLEGLQGNYLAGAGVQGAAPGQAAQAVDANEAFLRVSLERDRRPLAALVDWISVGE